MAPQIDTDEEAAPCLTNPRNETPPWTRRHLGPWGHRQANGSLRRDRPFRKAPERPAVLTRAALLPLRSVPGLGGLLGRAPPGLVVAVPADRLREAGGEVGAPRLPAELAAELGRVDGVAAVVAGSVAHPVEVALGTAEGLEDLAQDGQVVALAVGADEVGLADAAAGEDAPHGGAVEPDSCARYSKTHLYRSPQNTAPLTEW